MSQSAVISKYEELGKQWIAGDVKIKEITIGKQIYKLGFKQRKFVNNLKARFCLAYGGFGSGKTLALIIKLILLLLCFSGNRILLGRKTISDLERAFLPDFFEIVPKKWYKYKVKQGIIEFFNGSEIILFGLDSLQSGSASDIKKAQQKLKSLNLGAYFIDQLEEVEYDVVKVLNSRLRRTNVPIRQGNMTCNPANFWAYDYYKKKPKRDKKHKKLVFSIRMSMLDNRKFLPKDYLEEQLGHDEAYVKRFVYGLWTPDILIQSVVLAKEYIDNFTLVQHPPIAFEEGCEIFIQPDFKRKYQMGIDPSEGAIDPSSISIVDDQGRKVAKFNGLIPIPALIQKVEFLYNKYREPFIVPEVNAAGQALLEGIRNNEKINENNIYQRTVFDHRDRVETKKLGWKTTHASKHALISYFQELCRKNFPRIYDQNTIDEFKTFVWSDTVKMKGAGAERGFHDDDVISTMLAYWELKPVTISKIDFIKKEMAKRSSPKKKSFV